MEIFEKLIDNLELQLDELKQIEKISQTKELKSRGLVNKGGVLLFENSIDYRILLDYYYVVYADTVIKLIKSVYRTRTDLFTFLTLRTCIEMSMDRARIIYSSAPLIEEKQRLSFITCLMLDDYAFTAINDEENFRKFNKLFHDQESILDGKFKPIFSKISVDLKAKNLDGIRKNLRELRRSLSSKQGELILNIPLPLEFKQTNLKLITMTFSHILHGNIFLLNNVLLNTRHTNQRFQFYIDTTLLIAGATFINIIEGFLRSKGNYVVELETFNTLVQEAYIKMGKDYVKYNNQERN